MGFFPFLKTHIYISHEWRKHGHETAENRDSILCQLAFTESIKDEIKADILISITPAI